MCVWVCGWVFVFQPPPYPATTQSMARRPPTRASRTLSTSQHPAGSTSSSTLVNNELDEIEKQQAEYQATAGLHVFEVPEGCRLQPPPPQRKPSQATRDETFLTNRINSPGKHLRPTALHHRRAHHPSTEPEDMLSNTNRRDLNTLSSDEHSNNKHEQEPEEEEDDDEEEEDQHDETFVVDLQDGTRKMGALFDSVQESFHKSVTPSIQNIPEEPPSHQRDDYPARMARQIEPTPKQRPPFAHLRGKVDLSSKPAQETRQASSSHAWLDNNRVTNQSANVTTRSQIPSKYLPAHRAHAPAYPSSKSASSSAQNVPPKTANGPAINKDGWRLGPMTTTGKSPSDTESPEDTFHPPTSVPLDPAQKPLFRGASEYHNKKVTFSQVLADNNSLLASGSVLQQHQSRADPPERSSDTTTEDDDRPHQQRDRTEQTFVRADEPGQTTLATPKITGFYPSTPATLRPQARLGAGEDASRLEKLKSLKNVPSRARLKRVSSALDDEPGHLPPSSASLTSKHHPGTTRTGKGKEKQVDADADAEPLFGADPSQPAPADPAPAAQPAENYDQTVLNTDLTLAFQTPHPPGWFVPDPSGSTDRPPPTKPIRRPPSAAKLRKTAASSSSHPFSSAGDRVIFPSNARPPVVDDGTPRPRDVDEGPREDPAFSSPSFDGFAPQQRRPLTSTPAPPPKPLPRPPPPPGPVKTLKDLAATVIEFIVDKKPLDVLATTFSRTSQDQLAQKSLVQSRKQDMRAKESGQKELETLLLSSQKVEDERRRIQAKLDALQAANGPGRSSFLASLVPASLFSSLPRKRGPAGRSGRWKVVLVGLVVQTLLIWMALHLSTVRSYNRILDASASAPSASSASSTAMGGAPGMKVPGSLAYMSRDRLARVLSAHQRGPSTALRAPEAAGVREGVAELARFFVDWLAGFGRFFHPCARLLPPPPLLPLPPPPPPPPVHSRPLNTAARWLLHVSRLRPLLAFFRCVDPPAPPASPPEPPTIPSNRTLVSSAAPFDTLGTDHSRAILDFYHQFFPFVPT
ncbi:hypothetical protein, variant [Puccinia triticina 1-1 BBBD Race 1]|uniref:Uncharacterized protein n=1 Tax=Puccinia triticina (isolate 1-1 / race 1 (BBBD)) TaxID=630390 RepID=A0A180GW92_PUCT1|nr:hypothetical protein, variant [Puccinia triticina 1-1 BBBD Race 1]